MSVPKVILADVESTVPNNASDTIILVPTTGLDSPIVLDTPINRIGFSEYIILTVKFDKWLVEYNKLASNELGLLVSEDITYGKVLAYIRKTIKTHTVYGLYAYCANTLIIPSSLMLELMEQYGVVNRLTIYLAAENMFG